MLILNKALNLSKLIELSLLSLNEFKIPRNEKFRQIEACVCVCNSFIYYFY